MSPDFNYCTILPKMYFFFLLYFFKPKDDLLTKSFSQGGCVAQILDQSIGYKSSPERVYCIEFGLNGGQFPSYRRRFRLD